MNMRGIIVKKSKTNGLGVFATKDFKKGEVVLRWQSKKILTKEQVDKLSDEEKKYISSYTAGKYIHQVSPDKYVNHSCDPNTEVRDNCDVAMRDIKKGEEITSDYSLDSIQLHHFTCNCGSKQCKKYV